MDFKKLKYDIIGWDVENWSKAITFWDQSVNKLNIQLTNFSCLELGAGENGGLSLWLASIGNNVICSTYCPNSEQILNKIKRIHEKYDIIGSISYQQINALNIPRNSHYDLICFKSMELLLIIELVKSSFSFSFSQSSLTTLNVLFATSVAN